MRNTKNRNKIKIFFNVSSRCDQEVKNAAENIYNIFNNLGVQHTYDFRKDEKEHLTDSQTDKLYSSALKSLHKSDIVVLEISTNSFTQGYILHKALEIGKPVIALHRKGKYSVFVKGIKSNLLQTVEYDLFNLSELLQDSLDFAIENLMTKFNFYLPSDIHHYLNWISKNKKLAKSEFVRHLIRDYMTNDPEYSSSLS